MAFSYTLTNPTTYYFVNRGSYLESNNNGVNNSFALSVINFTIPAGETYHLYLDCVNYAESNYDYGILSNINQSLVRSNTADTDTTLVKKNFKGSSSSSTQTVDYGEISTSGTIDIKFRKDSSDHRNNDSLRVTIRAVPVQVQPAVPDISTTSLTKIFYGINKIAKMYYGTNLVFGTSGGGGETITDLTNTTWIINTVSYTGLPSNPEEEWEYNINFTSNNTNYSLFYLWSSPNSWLQLEYDTTVVKANSWSNEAYKTITITGGTDATNTDLIAWLQANATQQTQPEPQPVVEPYLTFSSPSAFTLNVVDNIKYWDGALEYSTDTTTWNEWSGTTTLNSSSSGNTKYLYLRGTGNTYITGSSALSTKAKWVLTGSNISCDGNIENLLDYQTVSNGNHPTMESSCYRNMFRSCTNLTTAPELPATTLADYCYYSMFYGCTNLTTAPELPATTLVNYCYQYMFYGCTALTTAPSLPATTLANYCYQYMFRGCTSLTTAPELPATTLANYCYYYMFYGCTNLTTPAIMADGTTQTTPAKQCCQQMYYGCTALNIYTTSSGHTAFYKSLTYSTTSSDTNYRSSYRMFYNCYIDGTQSTVDYLDAGTQYYY